MSHQVDRLNTRQVLQSANGWMRSRVQVPPSGHWSFWFECARDTCEEQVELDLAEYEALRAENGYILAPGHFVSRAEQARRVARSLVADAHALRQHSVQQQQRLRRIAAKYNAPPK